MDGAAAEGASAGVAPAPRRPWSPWSELRSDLRRMGITLAVLAVAGLPAGVLWWLLAPRADFRITSDGPVPIGNPSQELLVADDVVFTLVVAGLGLLAGVVLWFRRGFRGVAAVVALALGVLAAGGLAWQLGELLGPGPTDAALKQVGAQVTTGLHLASWPAVAIGPAVALLAYFIAAALDGREDLGRSVERRSVDGHGDGEALQRGGHGPEGPQQGELAPQQP